VIGLQVIGLQVIGLQVIGPGGDQRRIARAQLRGGLPHGGIGCWRPNRFRGRGAVTEGDSGNACALVRTHRRHVTAFAL